MMTYTEKTHVQATSKWLNTEVTNVEIDCPVHGKQVIQTFAFRADQVNCPLCERESAEQQKIQQLARQRYQRAMSAGIPKCWYQAGFSSWQASSERQQKIVSYAQVWAESFSTSASNIIFAGTTGTGKTMLASIIASTVNDMDKSVCMLRSSDFKDLVKDTCSKFSPISELDLLRHWTTCDLLVIDEFGEGDVVKEEDRDRISKIINGRYVNGKPTIITSNLNKSQVIERLGDKSWDRLQENLIFVNFDWQSYRQLNRLFVEL